MNICEYLCKNKEVSQQYYTDGDTVPGKGFKAVAANKSGEEFDSDHRYRKGDQGGNGENRDLLGTEGGGGSIDGVLHVIENLKAGGACHGGDSEKKREISRRGTVNSEKHCAKDG